MNIGAHLQVVRDIVHPEKASSELWSQTHLDSTYSFKLGDSGQLKWLHYLFKFPVLSPVNYFAGLVIMYLKSLVDYLAPSMCSRNGQSVRSGHSLCQTLCDPMDWSTQGFSVHHQILELAQTHVHWVSDAIQPSHPLSSPSLLAFSLSLHQSLFQWVSSLHQVAKVLVLQLQHQSFQWKFRTYFL